MTLKFAFAALAMIGGVALAAPAAQAMPRGLAAPAVNSSGVENVRWVCGPYRCWWQPRRHHFYSPYGYYAPPRFHGRPHRPAWGSHGRRW